MIRFLLKLWGKFPLWTHTLATSVLRPRFPTGVAALVFNEQGQVLLFKHTYRKFPWGIPGGGLEYGEQPIDAIAREFYEETSITIEVRQLLLAHSSPYYRHIGLVYLCEIISGEFRESNEISEMRYFNVNDLPPMLFDEKDLLLSVHKNMFVSKSLE